MAGVVHISEEEAARDIVSLLERARDGEKIKIESSGRPGVMIVSEEPIATRSISDRIAALENPAGTHLPSMLGHDRADASDATQHRNRDRPWDAAAPPSQPPAPGRTAGEIIDRLATWEARNGKITLDDEFVSDMEDIHRLYNEPLDGSKWD